MARRTGIEDAFRDHKGGGFHLYAVRMSSPARIKWLLLVTALACLLLVAAGGDAVRSGERKTLEPGAEYRISRFQFDWRPVHRAVWRGDRLELGL